MFEIIQIIKANPWYVWLVVFIVQGVVQWLIQLSDHNTWLYSWLDGVLDGFADRFKLSTRGYLAFLNATNAFLTTVTILQVFPLLSENVSVNAVLDGSLRILFNIWWIGLFAYQLQRIAVRSHRIDKDIQKNGWISFDEYFQAKGSDSQLVLVNRGDKKIPVPVFFKFDTRDQAQQAMMSAIRSSFYSNINNRQKAKEKTHLEKTSGLRTVIANCHSSGHLMKVFSKYVSNLFPVLDSSFHRFVDGLLIPRSNSASESFSFLKNTFKPGEGLIGLVFETGEASNVSGELVSSQAAVSNDIRIKEIYSFPVDAEVLATIFSMQLSHKLSAEDFKLMEEFLRILAPQLDALLAREEAEEAMKAKEALAGGSVQNIQEIQKQAWTEILEVLKGQVLLVNAQGQVLAYNQKFANNLGFSLTDFVAAIDRKEYPLVWDLFNGDQSFWTELEVQETVGGKTVECKIHDHLYNVSKVQFDDFFLLLLEDIA